LIVVTIRRIRQAWQSIATNLNRELITIRIGKIGSAAATIIVSFDERIARKFDSDSRLRRRYAATALEKCDRQAQAVYEPK